MDTSGTDRYYRENVVIPSLVREALTEWFESFVDIGSGDGYGTELFLAACEQKGRVFPSVTPIALSAEHDWSADIRSTAGPRFLTLNYVLQELPNLNAFFQTLANSMEPGDVCTAIVVHPDYADALNKLGKLTHAQKAGPGDDWNYTAKYPIAVEHKIIYTPFFSRSFNTYIQSAAAHGLSMYTPISLRLPNNKTSRDLYRGSVYGEEILYVSSSALLIFTKA